MNKLLFLFTTSLLMNTVHAQVFKCTDLQGNISYTNSKLYSQSKACSRTDIDEYDKSYYSSHTKKSSGNSGIVQANFNPNPALQIKSDEQKSRDEKRSLILSQELKNEEEQMATVQIMFDKVKNTSDETQKISLQEMLETHQRNIKSLKKELKIPQEVVVSQISTKVSN